MPETFRVFLDANVLARPVTRTLLLVGADKSGYRPVWSETAVLQADRHLRPGSAPVADLSIRFGWTPADAADLAGRFGGTDPDDRQILADADAAGALFLVTEDVDDFAVEDLRTCGMSAVTADLFMAARFSDAAYIEALEVLTAHRARPPNTPEAMHQALGHQHPRLAGRMAHLFSVPPDPPVHREPGAIFRGDRCLWCTSRSDSSAGLELGFCGSGRQL